MIFWRRYVARTYTRTGNILWDRMFPVRFGNAKNIKIGLEIYPMGVYNTNEKGNYSNNCEARVLNSYQKVRKGSETDGRRKRVLLLPQDKTAFR